MTDPLVGSSPALDRLRALIQEMKKSNVHANSENGNRVVGSWLVEDWIVRLSKLFSEVRELVPVPPQPQPHASAPRNEVITDARSRLIADFILAISEDKSSLNVNAAYAAIDRFIADSEAAAVPPAPQTDELERVGLALGTNGQFQGLLAGGTAYPHANAVLNVLAERDNLRKRLAVVPPAPSGAPNPEIEAFWTGVQRGWDIEPREYFEREAPKNGFKFPIAQALHHIWKRCVTENPPFGVAAPAPSAPPPAERLIVSKLRELVKEYREGAESLQRSRIDIVSGDTIAFTESAPVVAGWLRKVAWDILEIIGEGSAPPPETPK